MTAALIGLATLLAGVLAFIIRISFQIGALVQKFGDHIADATTVHTDQEQRIRALEQRPRPRRA